MSAEEKDGVFGGRNIGVKPVSWFVGLASLGLIVLQSVCTAAMALSGLRFLIGVGALAAATGLIGPLDRIHGDWIRIPMMALAVVGSGVNLFVLWRIRSLRRRPSSQWRMQAVPAKQRRAEAVQIGLAILTLVLVVAEWWTHRIVHHNG